MKKLFKLWFCIILSLAPLFMYSQNLIGNIITSTEENDGTGDAVAISDIGDRIIVGTSFGLFGQPDNMGYARVYQLINNIWQPLGQALMEDLPSDDFGESVCISSDGNRVAVGGSEGAVVYDFNGSTWEQIGDYLRLSGLSLTSQIENIRMSKDGKTIAISGFSSSMTNIVVYGLSEDQWIQKGNDFPVDAGLRFGLSDDGNRIAFTAKDPGSQFDLVVRVFEFQMDSWVPLGSVIEMPSGFRLTEGLDLSGNGNRVIFSLSNIDGSYNGAIASFDFVGNEWVQTGPVSYAEIFTPYGVSLRTTQDGNTIVIGNSDDLPADGTTVFVRQLLDDEWQVLGDSIANVANDETSDGHVDITADGTRFVMGGVKSGPNDFRGFVKVYDFGNPSALDNLPNLFEAKISPNPTSGLINVSWAEKRNNLLIQVLNSSGQILDEQIVAGDQCFVKLPMTQGLYIVNLLAQDGRRQAFKVIKQ